jgi:outer membrane lipoprotein-sorting protein
MKKLLVLIICISAIAPLFAQDLSPDEIVSKNLKAIGQDKLMNFQTLKVTGKMTQQGLDFQITQYQKKKPEQTRQEIEVQGMSIIMVVDGETGWTINPMTGSTEAQDLPADAIKSLEKEGRGDPTVSWDNPFLNWKENGTSIELAGMEDNDGASAYNLKVTFEDKYVINYFVDAKSFLLLKSKSTEAAQGQTFDREIKFSDFRDIDGILVPVKIEVMINGQVGQVFTMDKCEFNVPIDDSIFKKPVPENN